MDNQSKFNDILNSDAKMIAVIAGPGSGKTKGILIPKAQKVLADQLINPKKVLLLTFSRHSAQDLQNKIKAIDRTPSASTLHSLCLSFLLSENNHDIRKRVDSILLNFEKQYLVSDLKLLLPDLHKNKIRKMLEEFSAGWAVKPHEEVFDETDEKIKFKTMVINWLSEHEAAMMEEIVYGAVDLIKKMKAQNITSELINEPQYIFVDEFQDLNKLEQEFVDLLAESSELLLIVGDPDQSIYSFKYAFPEGIVGFSERPEVEEHTLEYIGRCAKKITRLANKILLQDDPLRTSLLKPLDNSEEGNVVIVSKNTQDDEFDYIYNKTVKKISSGIKPEKILILFPRKKLCNEFVNFSNSKLGLSEYSFHSTSKNEFENIERERILLFSLITNPKSILHIRSYLGLEDESNYSSEIAEVKAKYGNLLNALKIANPNDFDSRKRRVRQICERLIYLNEFLIKHTSDKPLAETIDELFPEDNSELEDLRKEIINLKEDTDTPSSLYRKLLDYIRTANTKETEIRVMTLLSSKGLEADYVFIAGCNDGNIPGENRSTHLDDFSYKKEQRRLLYVGVTRARKELIITWSRYIPFEQARGNHTANLGVVTINGRKYCKVGMSEFLENLIGGEN